MHFSSDDFPSIAYEGHFDLVVSECGHINADELMEKMQGVDTSALAVTHVNVEVNMPRLKEIQSTYEGKMYLPCDGDTVEI